MRHGALYRRGRFEQDLAAMIYARRIAVSRTTLAHAVLNLSPVPKLLYSFEVPRNDAFGLHAVCVPTPEYGKNVLHPWRANSSQFDLMMTDACQWVRSVDISACI
jgi:hypothetical protein